MATQTYQIEAKLVASGAKAFQSAFSKAEDSVKKFNESGKKISAVGDKMSAVGDKLTKTVTVPLLAVGTAAVGTAAKFESSMSEVQAISGATGDEMKDLKKLAREMGATTKFSASEAADGLKYMALAGWDVEQMSAALPAVLDLAAASGEDLGITSDIVTDALSAFGLEAEDAAGFADLLASASSNSNTNVSMLGESFKYVAPVMGALGVTTEDTALALGLMADNGIKGSQAGTQLRNMMTSLVDPTDAQAEVMQKYGIELDKNADGTINLQGTMDNLRSTLGGLSEDQQAQAASTLFGKNAMAGALAIVNTTEESYENLALATQDYDGAAKNMADTMQDNLLGAWIELKSALSEAAISIGDILLPMIRNVVDKIKGWITAFNNLDDSTKEIIVKIGLYVAALGPMISITGRLVSGVGNAVSAIGKFSSGIGGIPTPTGLAIGAVAALVGALVIYIRNADNTGNATRKLTDATRESTKAFREQREELENGDIVNQVHLERLEELANKTELSAGEQEEMKRTIEALSATYPELNEYINEETGALTLGKDALDAYIESAKKREELDLIDERRTTLLAEQAEAKKNLIKISEELGEAEADLAESQSRSDQMRVDDAQRKYDIMTELIEGHETELEELNAEYNQHAEVIKENEEAITASKEENAAARTGMSEAELLAYGDHIDDKEAMDAAAAEAMAAALEEQQKAYDDYYKELHDKTESIYQKMGGLGDGAVKKIELTAADVKKNLEEQIADWNSWQTSIGEIQGRVPQVMVDELSKMGPAAQPLLDEYNNMTDEELSEHVKLFTEKHALARQSAMAELGSLPDEAKGIANTSVEYVHEVGKDMRREAERFGQQGVEGYASTKGDFANAVGEVTNAGLDAAGNKVGQMSDVGVDAGYAYAEGVEDSTGQSSTAGDDLAQSAVDSARSTQIISAWRTAGVNSAESYRLGVKFKQSEVYSTGQNFGQTFANGIRSKWNQSYNAGYSLGLAANQGQRNALSIRSPSRVAKENAENFGQSFVDNLLKLKSKAAAAGQEFTQAAIIPLEQPVSVSTNYSANGGGSLSLGEQSSGIPANINLSIGGRDFEAFVDDISQVQDVSTQLKLSYA